MGFIDSMTEKMKKEAEEEYIKHIQKEYAEEQENDVL